jgi:hypothetical protein
MYSVFRNHQVNAAVEKVATCQVLQPRQESPMMQQDNITRLPVVLAQEEYAESFCQHRRDNFRNIRVDSGGSSCCQRLGVDRLIG